MTQSIGSIPKPSQTHLSGVIVALAISVGFCLGPSAIEGRDRGAQVEHWVASWAVAQQLMPGTLPGQGGRGPDTRGPATSSQAGTAKSSGAEPAAQPRPTEARFPRPSFPTGFNDQTIRMIVHATLGGPEVRVSLSNMFNGEPIEIGPVHIAMHGAGGATIPGTDRVVTFAGAPSVLIRPGVLMVSDAVKLDVRAGSELAVSLYVPHETGPPTLHTQAGQTVAYISRGDVTGMQTLEKSTPAPYYAWLSSIEVYAGSNDYAVIALGDSITDSLTSWAPLLAERLRTKPKTRNVAVVNAGIAGNQVLRDGAGLSALSRFDRDVLCRPGVRWVVLLEGINDIQLRGMKEGPDALSADELIGGYKQIIERAHIYGMRVAGATITSYMGVRLASERGEKIRRDVNDWIRTKGNFDAFIDFDDAVRDPTHPGWLRMAFDSGDHIHPSEAGQKALAARFDLSVFR